MEENLIGYLLNALDERTRQEVEYELAHNHEAREKLVQLRQVIEPLADDQAAALPEPFLVERTLARVAEHICTTPQPVPEPEPVPEPKPAPELSLPQAPPLAPTAVPVGRSWWRRVDVLVAACLLVMVGLIGLTVLGRLRGPSSVALIADCKNNLRHFFSGLEQYRTIHGEFPDISREAPRNVAGMVVPLLLEAGTLPKDSSIRCPGNGPAMSCPLSLAALRAMSDADFVQRSPCLSMCYAYSLGHRDGQGNYHAPGSGAVVSLSQLPLMADRPPVEGVMRNSLNHDCAGQNVLFSDGHVVFLPQRTYGSGDDIFLNRDLKVAAGVDARDIVLGFSAARP